MSDYNRHYYTAKTHCRSERLKGIYIRAIVQGHLYSILQPPLSCIMHTHTHCQPLERVNVIGADLGSSTDRLLSRDWNACHPSYA